MTPPILKLETRWAEIPVGDFPAFNPEVDTVTRQSTIGQMLLCEMREYYKDHEGFLEPVSERMAFGTCTHWLIEQDLKAGEVRLDLLTDMGEWVNELLVTEFDWSLGQVKNAQHFFSELGVAYRTWRTQIHPKLKGELLGVEEEVYLYLGPGYRGNIFLKGTPDIVFDSHIRDMKTSKSMWKEAKADVSIQASLYLALAKELYNSSARKFIFDVYDRSKSTWLSLPVTRRVKDINAALLQAYAIGRKQEAGLFSAHPVPESSFTKKRGWYCGVNYCPAWNVCEYKYLGDDVNENEVAVRSW